MIYVMSDIHGCYDKYIEMINKIDLKKEDTLYILGDVIDRGSNPFDIIDHIRANDNIVYIKGNHEEMMIGYLDGRVGSDTDNIDYSYSWFDNMWFNTGGNMTYGKLKEKEDSYVADLYNYINGLPLSATVTMEDGRNFLLVHAGVFIPQSQQDLSFTDILRMQDEETLLWDRNFVESNKILNGFTVVCGHTPVQTMTIGNKEAKILYKDGKILIDCGAVFDILNGKLACIRLDDMMEYYV